MNALLPVQDQAPTLTDRWTSLATIDQVGLVIISIFMVLGVWRGLWWQIIRFLGVILSIALARTLTPILQPTVEGSMNLSPAVSHGVAWGAIFLAGLVVATLLGLLGKKTLEAMKLGLVDRAGGAVVGGLTGLILHSALVVVLCAVGTPKFTEGVLEGSRSRFVLTHLAQRNNIILDAQAAETIVGKWARTWDVE